MEVLESERTILTGKNIHHDLVDGAGGLLTWGSGPGI